MAKPNTTASDDGTEITWSRVGTGHPVVLVHGITESKASFDPVTERLATTNEVIILDLRGHGASGRAATYDLASMAGDIASVIVAAGIERPHLVGHSLEGAVATVAGSMLDVASVVDIDQSLQLDGFKAQLMPAEAMLRRRTGEGERAPPRRSRGGARRVGAAPHPAGRAHCGHRRCGARRVRRRDVAYLALFGIDPGDEYGSWLSARIPGAQVEYWEAHGHYPHLVDPDRFVARLHDFWGS